MSANESKLFRGHAGSRSFDRHTRKLIARIQKNHGDNEAVEALAAHYTKQGDHASLANLMEGYGETLSAATSAAEAYVRAADAALLSADRGRAEALYERALMRDPSHTEALDRALRVAEAERDGEAMRRILTAVLSAALARRAEPKLLASLHFRLGQVYERHVRDLDQATLQYRSAIDLNPLFANATAAARRLYERAGNHAAVSALYEIEIEVAKTNEDKRDLLLALAQHARQRCLDLDAAVDALQRACSLEPADAATLRKLADGLTARSSSDRETRQRDHQQAADVLYRLARMVPRADAAALLAEALELLPEHARATALLAELRGHTAEQATNATNATNVAPASPHARVSQLVLDHRATLKMFVAPNATETLRTEATERDDPANATQALSTRDLVPIRPEPPKLEPADSATQALSTADLMPIRPEPDDD